MNTMTTEPRLELETNERQFQADLAKFQEFKRAESALIQEALSLGLTVTEEELKKASNPYLSVTKMLFDKLSKGLTLGAINHLKYLELTDIDLTVLSSLSNTYARFSEFSTEPIIEDYKLYVTGDKMEFAKKMIALADQLNTLRDEGVLTSLPAIPLAFNHNIVIESSTFRFKFNTQKVQ